MKKTLLKILVAMVSLVIMVGALVGCGGSFSTSMTDWGNTDGYKNGGFVRETEKYFYVINGQGKNTDSNSFGDPIKGSLVAVAKEGFGTEDQKVEIVVPKLLVGTDYGAGIYIFGDEVYFATTSTDKTPDGDIANDHLAFSSAKLDGTGFKTYFTVEGLSTQFRVVKSGEDVIFIYYDAQEKEIATFNTTTEEKVVIAKTDDKADSETLKSYYFVDNANTNDVAVIYTTTVYAEAYDEARAEAQGDSYQRTTETFNNVYAYKVGDESAKLVLDGKFSAPEVERELKLTYTVNFVGNGKVYYKQIDTENLGVEKSFVIGVKDLYEGKAATVITNATDAVATTLIANDKAYKIKDKKIVATTLTGDVVFAERTVANTADASKLLFVEGEYIYYSTSKNVLMRVNIDYDNLANYTEKELAEQRVSDDSIHTSWYTPEVITVNGKTFALAIDNSALGALYVKAFDLGAEINETEEDGVVTERYLDGDFHVAVLADLDIAVIAEKKIGELDKALTSNGNIVFDTTDEDGKPSMQAVIDARGVYESLTKAQKDLLSDGILEKIEKYEKAIEISIELDGLKDFDKAKTAEEKDAFKTAYESAKKVIDKLESTEEGQEISRILVENYRWFYQEADKYFNPED